ncbi:TetR/AcrR family transcriptional regulator [Dyella solisilvae]|uniref:TetR/AcrR family transcriptional regulator n=1 Tax=Dyella solisilvae TaxID=1920168 RepID=A0A370K9S9_9GAMM|nr:TetR/AcrR family transcriptional regulator [Dyella solisilvae]RDI99389.1 TetR/AcrR family transcriptional regulator [Dyella solisilvae]
MRYASHHKQATRERIVEAAARRFREKGFDASGVQGLMEAAGLTHGAFFNHFASKEDLVAEATSAALDQRVNGVRKQLEAGRGIEGYIRSYLSLGHRDNPGRGCAAATLAAEVARRSVEVRQAFAEGVSQLIEILAAHWPDLPPEEASARAMALYGLMSGTMQLARATPDEALSRRILEAGIQAALELLSGKPGSAPG